MDVFIDSNVILEGRAPEDQPWAELDSNGQIVVWVVPQVLREIDKHKSDGRIGKRARNFNRNIAPVILGSGTWSFGTSPSVEFRVTAAPKIDWDTLSGFDADEPDDRVVAQALHAAEVPNERKLFLSQDMNPIRLARDAGLTVHRLEVNWLAPQQPSPQERELQRVKEKLRAYEVSEPLIEVEILAVREVEVVRVPAIDSGRRDDYLRAMLQAAPNGSTSRSPFEIGISSDHSFSRRIERYRDVVLPDFAENIEKHLGHFYSQVEFTARVANTGELRADRLIARLEGEGLLLHNRCLALFPNGPTPPERRELSTYIARNIVRPEPLIGPHEIHYDREPVAGERSVEVHCADFRHPREWVFQGFAAFDPDAEVSRLRLEVTASNLRGTASQEFTFERHLVEVPFEELIDVEALKYLRRPELLFKLIEEAKGPNAEDARVDMTWLADDD